MKSLKLDNFLSFGKSDAPVELRPLNVIIGPNGSGKSSFLEAIDFMRLASVPSRTSSLHAAIRRGGGVRNWIWKGKNGNPHASIEAVFDKSVSESPKGQDLRYRLSFSEVEQQFEITDERIEGIPSNRRSKPNVYYKIVDGRGVLNTSKSRQNDMEAFKIDRRESVLAQMRTPEKYREIIDLSDSLAKVCLYRSWTFGHDSAPRKSQDTNLPNDHLDPDSGNLGMVLNRIRSYPDLKEKYLSSLQELYDGIVDFDVKIVEGTMQVTIQEEAGIIPATQLSDGALRYLCLLAVLCDPDPGPMVCIEEPELGMHPDIMPIVARMLLDASERTQLVVTTHSEMLVDSMTDHPEAILVACRGSNGTRLERLSAENLKPWLKKYRLGDLWTSGQIGGTRW